MTDKITDGIEQSILDRIWKLCFKENMTYHDCIQSCLDVANERRWSLDETVEIRLAISVYDDDR